MTKLGIFINEKPRIIITYYVDDLMITGPSKTNIDVIVTKLNIVLVST